MIFIACDIEDIGKNIFQGTLYDRKGVQSFTIKNYIRKGEQNYEQEQESDKR